MELLTALAVGALFGIAIFQMLRRNVIRSAIGLILLGAAINLFLLSTGAYQGTEAAYVGAAYAGADGQVSDALPQALILTAIVISMGGISLVLAMLYVLSARYRTGDLDEINELRG